TGDGKKEGIRYRARLALDPEEKGIDLSAPIYFSRFGEWTKKSGFARVLPGQSGATCLCWDDAEFGTLMKARNADVFVFTRETYKDSPDYHSCDATFKDMRKISDVFPQQDRYLWSSGVRLLDYKSTKGDRLQAALLLPAGYE